MLIMYNSREAINNRPYIADDIKVRKHTKDSTYLSQWQTYYFSAKKMDLFPLIRKEKYGSKKPVFCFYSLHCETLQEAKQHIAECLNNGKKI